MSLLFKIVQAWVDTQVGILSDFTDNCPRGTIDKLLDTHFPGRISYNRGDNKGDPGKITVLQGHHQQDVATDGHFITRDKIHWAINSFGNTKAADLDGLKPGILKNLPESSIESHRILYTCSLHNRYVPLRW